MFKNYQLLVDEAVERLNRKINLVTRKSYGFRRYDILKIALFHTMIQLPGPEKPTHFFEETKKSVLNESLRLAIFRFQASE